MSTAQTGASPTQQQIDRARDLFGLGPKPERREIISAWRSAVRLAHPDLAGANRSAAAERLMQRINESRDTLLRAADADARSAGRDPEPPPPPGTQDEPGKRPSAALLAALEAARSEAETDPEDTGIPDPPITERKDLFRKRPRGRPTPLTRPAPGRQPAPLAGEDDGPTAPVRPRPPRPLEVAAANGFGGEDGRHLEVGTVASGSPVRARPPVGPVVLEGDSDGADYGRTRGRGLPLPLLVSLGVVSLAILIAAAVLLKSDGGGVGASAELSSGTVDSGAPTATDTGPASSPPPPTTAGDTTSVRVSRTGAQPGLSDAIRTGALSPASVVPVPVTDTPDAVARMFAAAVADGDVAGLQSTLWSQARIVEVAELVDAADARLTRGLPVPTDYGCMSSLDGTWGQCSFEALGLARAVEFANTPDGWRLAGWMP